MNAQLIAKFVLSSVETLNQAELFGMGSVLAKSLDQSVGKAKDMTVERVVEMALEVGVPTETVKANNRRKATTVQVDGGEPVPFNTAPASLFNNPDSTVVIDGKISEANKMWVQNKADKYNLVVDFIDSQMAY